VSFWNLADGSSAVTNEKEFDAGGGDFEVIPKGTNVLVAVEDATWKAGFNVTEEFVNLKVRVMKPAGYENRVLFFKLWVDELDPGVKDPVKAETKRDKHKRMLMAIDANGKGRLAKVAARPTDEQLALALTGVQFVATLGVWDKEDPVTKAKTPGGNWLMKASSKSAEVSPGPAPRGGTGNGTSSAGRARGAIFEDDLDDDVPFITCDSMF